MNKLLASVALPAATLLLLAVAACSTPESNTRRVAGGAVPRFQKLDANNDGKVTFAEFDAGFADTIFATYGRGIDGAVSREEWNAVERANQDSAATSFRGLDRNRDGKLTRDELSTGRRRNAVVRRIFNRADANHDGAIVLEEARKFGIERAADQDPANHP